MIERVHELAEDEGAEDLDDDGCPIFEWEICTPVGNIHSGEDPRDPYDGDTVNDTTDDDNKSTLQPNEDDNDNDNDDLVDGDTSDEDDILVEQTDDDNSSLSDPSDASETLNEDPSDADKSQEFRSGNSRHKTRSEESRSDELNDSGDSTSDKDKVEGADLGSEVNSDNIIDGQRTRTGTRLMHQRH